MRLTLLMVALSALAAQVVPDPNPSDPDRVRALVEAGVLPKARLAQVEEAAAEARDESVLRRTLYGAVSVEDLTEEQIQDMLGAARGRVDRQRARVDHAKRLVDEGVAPRLSLSPLLEEFDARRKTFDLATSRSNLFRELAEMVRAEVAYEESLESTPEEQFRIAERFDGSGVFRMADLRTIVLAFEKEFRRPLPISARGSTRLHRALGFDHRDRVDVALNPDQAEGQWLRRFLETAGTPYFAFRSYVPGRSTAPHIHIGPPSVRLRIAD